MIPVQENQPRKIVNDSFIPTVGLGIIASENDPASFNLFKK